MVGEVEFEVGLLLETGRMCDHGELFARAPCPIGAGCHAAVGAKDKAGRSRGGLRCRFDRRKFLRSQSRRDEREEQDEGGERGLHEA
jgi:hypothetical protein